MRAQNRLAVLGYSFAAFCLVLLTPSNTLARSIRTAEVDEGSVVVVKTAIGFSTILEFQSKPISAVLGDQDSFKLEYVGNSITLKPLVHRAQSNLFVFTEFDRFNCQIVTVPASQVDYIVRLRNHVKSYPLRAEKLEASASDAKNRLLTRSIQRSANYGGFTLAVISLSRERDLANPRAVTLIDFALSSKRQPYAFSTQSIGVKQSGFFLNIESLYLDGLSLAPGAPPVRGKLALLSQDFKPRLPLAVVFAVPALEKRGGSHRIEVSTESLHSNPALEGKKTHEKGK